MGITYLVLCVLIGYIDYVYLMSMSISFSRKEPATRLCLPGPEMKESRFSKKRRCLIVGDSVSIGYTKYIQKYLVGRCAVYHAPWDITDGGALDTKHGVKCLKLLMTSSEYHHVAYDVIVFNFGLHDVNCDHNRPEEFTFPHEYSRNLEFLKSFFLQTNATVIYALTTPVLDDCDVDNLVVKYNRIASDVMSRYPRVDVIDLYKVITDRCGDPPIYECYGITNTTMIPHYTKYGYSLLAKPIAEAIKHYLTFTSKRAEISFTISWPPQNDAVADKNVVYCKRNNTVRSACPRSSTCVKNINSGSGFACCLHPDAVDCHTDIHCCPKGTRCSDDCTKMECSCVTGPVMGLE